MCNGYTPGTPPDAGRLLQRLTNAVTVIRMNTNEEARRVSRVRRLGKLGAARAIREDAQIGLREMARLMQVQPSNLCRWERGEVSPRPAAALIWADVLEALER